jgi:hypothetical protein
MSLFQRVKRELIVLGVIFASGIIFLSAAGYVTIGLPQIFAFEPYVSITKSAKSAQGTFGSLYNASSLVTYDIKPYFTTNQPSILNQLTLKVDLRPEAFGTDNGLRNFSLSYMSCHPGPYAYGYYPTVCEQYIAYPTSVIGDSAGSLITFSPGWRFYKDATRQMITLSSSMVFSGKSSTRTREIHARLRSNSDAVFVQEGSTRRQVVRVANGSGNWLTINGGYGYPR